MLYEMTPQASEAIFQWAATTGEQDSGKIDFGKNLIVEEACKLQDLFVDSESGDLIDFRSIDYKDVLPHARRLARLVLDDSEKDAPIYNVAKSLLGWCYAPPTQGRAWNIKSASRQLVDMVLTPKTVSSVDDDMPF